MAIVKVLGMETEYGIIIRGAADPNPIAASSTLINAYVAELNRKVEWDFEDETPGRDARGFAREGSMPPEVETHLVNAVLTNGARYYVDHAHPEYSTPECANALDAIRYDKAGELILARSVAAAARVLPPGQSLLVLKNNSDGKGNSYGAHENYLMDRSVPFARIVSHVMPHFVSRQIYTGAGKVGCEASSQRQRGDPLPAHPAGRLLRGGSRTGDHPQAPHRQHPGRAALRLPEVPPPARHRRRRQHVRGRQLPEGRVRPRWCWP